MTDVRSENSSVTANASGPNPPGSFIWYELMTTDPDGAKEFYDAVVGWDIGPPHDNMGYRMIARSDGGSAGGVLPITHDMQQHGARSAWNGYLSVTDIHATVKSIEGAGGRVLMPRTEIDQVGTIAMVTDPQGAPFYMMTPNPPKDDPGARSDVFSPDAVQRCGWNELQTSDVEASRRFYREQFGWGSDEYMDMGEMGLYRFWDAHGERFGALFDASNGQPSHWRFYFRVPSVSAAKTAVETNGGLVHMGPHQVPTGDWIIIGSDPQGAELALVGGA